MSTFLAHIITDKGLSVTALDDQGEVRAFVVNDSHPNFSLLKTALKEGDADSFIDNVNVEEKVAAAIGNTTGHKVTISNGCVYCNGEPLHNVITSRILDLMRQGFDINPMVKFLENLSDNPSFNSINQLYDFLANKMLPITDDGCFLGYKTIRQNWLDKYSGTIDNSIGKVVSVDRSKVDDNPNSHCSFGLHVGAWEYAGHGGWYNSPSDRVVIVKVNPKNAVSVPGDHSFQKLRVCEYEVVAECNEPLYKAKYDVGDNKDIYSQNEVVEDCDIDDDWDFFDGDEGVCEVDDLTVGDQIECLYTDRAGVTKTRFVVIDEVNDDSFTVFLMSDDPSYVASGNNYRRFLKDNIDNVKFIYE